VRYAVSEEKGLIAKVRIPLDPKSALILSALAIEHPEHTLEVDGIWLVMKEVEAYSTPSRSRRTSRRSTGGA